MLFSHSNIVISLLATLVSLSPNLSAAADITLEPSNWKPEVPIFHLHLEGRVEAGDLDRIQQLLSEVTIPDTSWIAFSMNSPGGDLDEGLRIASFFQDFPIDVATDVLKRDGTSGSCASACSIIYLSGTFRYLSEGSKLGVHQFRYVEDTVELRSRNTELVQRQSAQITSVLSKANVDADFFSLMASTAPSEMNWVDPEVLEDLWVITNDLSYQDSRLKLVDGDLSLIMTQMGMYGASRLTALCNDENIIFRSEMSIEGSEPDTLHNFEILIDRYPVDVEIVNGPDFVDLVGSTEFRLSNKALSAILNSERLDVRLANDMWGFFGTGFDLSGQDLADLIENCIEVTPTLPIDFGTQRETEDPLSPVQTTAVFNHAMRNRSPATAPAPEPEPQYKLSTDDDLIAAYNNYLADWSRPNEYAMRAMDRMYADELDFYGDIITKTELLEQKNDFAERWPERVYSARQDEFRISCPEVNLCLISTIIEWKASSQARGKTAKGVAHYGLGFDIETGLIHFEDGESRKY